MSTSSRTIRVFVSSTFRDMQEDRDRLVKFVFPQLRRLCESRGVTWGEVDLRWGITEEEAAEGKVLPLCLEEIRRCQPYFIGLLGERYGWVAEPAKVSEDLLEREPWLTDYLQRSVTELEIIHGVLRDPAMQRRAFFYFRDPRYLAHLPNGRERADFESESAEARDRLGRLKRRIRAARDGEVCQLRESYRDPKELGAWILEDFTQLIDELYPEGEQPDDLDREAVGHESFARSRAGIYIGGQEYFDRLDSHVTGDGPPLIVLGESGSGKSALLANWFLDRFCSPASELEPSGTFALIHFIGSTADSADVTRLMQRIMLEVKRRFDLPGDMPAMPDQIREAFPQWLTDAAGANRIVLVLDALNQVDDQDRALDLGWLPRVLPKNVRLIVSTLPGRSLDAVRGRQWPEVTVRPLTVSERKDLIEKFLAQFSRKLSPSRVGRIAESEQTANPLFLRAMLDELRQFGEHDRLGDMIERYLSAPDPQALYQRILERWEHDYGEGLVHRTLSLLWAARRGLSESELLDLLGTGDEPLPRAAWTPFFLAAESALAQRSGLLQFFHDYLRDAVRERCVQTQKARKFCHITLAEYFSGRGTETDRVLDELPWQWRQAGEWARLKSLLTQVEVFRRLRSTQRWKQDLQAYWLSLKAYYDLCEAYREALDRWETDLGRPGLFATSVNELGVFHFEWAEYAAAEPLFRRALASNEALYGPRHPNVAANLNNLAELLRAKNRLAEAEPLYRRALAIDEATYGPAHPRVATSLNNLAGLLQSRNCIAEVESLFRRALAIEEASYGLEHPTVAICLSNLASLLHETNRFVEAESLFRRALAIDEASYGPDHPDVAITLNQIAGLLQATNRVAEAETLFRRVLAIAFASYGHEHPAVARSLNNLAELLRATNRLTEAEPLYCRALLIVETFFGPDHPKVATTLSGLASLLQATNRLSEAESLFRRALLIDETSYGPDHPAVATRLNLVAELLRATNRIAEAEPLFRRALVIQETSWGPDHPNVATTLSGLALLLQATNRLSEAEPLLRRALTIDETSYGPDHPTVAMILNNLAELLRTTNRLSEAEPLLRRALAIDETSRGPDCPDVSRDLSNLAVLLRETNRQGEAEPLFRRALAIDEASYGPDHPILAIDLNNLASLLRATNRAPEAEPLFRRALAIEESSHGPDHPMVAIILNNLAELLRAENRLAEAEPLSRRVVTIFLKSMESTGHPHPHLQGTLRNYAGLLRATGQTDAEARQQIGDLLGRYGMSIG